MTAPTATVVVSFRNAGLPRPLANRFIAVAHHYRDTGHWLVTTVADGSLITATSFEAAVSAVQMATGVRHLLITWTGQGAGLEWPPPGRRLPPPATA